jgi:menaquinone-dependent protoporphyrinogen oxidase
MSGSILVTYASRGGATRGVAETIGKTLLECGSAVEVLPMDAVADVGGYRAVVAGSAIRGGKWLPEAITFMLTHQGALQRRPFAAFLVCLTLTMGKGKYHDQVASWMAPVEALVPPVSVGLFAGALDANGTLEWSFNTAMMRAAVALGVFGRGDQRDWSAIQGWAKELAPLLE